MESLRFTTPEDLAWELAHQANREHGMANYRGEWRNDDRAEQHAQNYENYSAMAAPMMFTEDSVFSVRGVERFLAAQTIRQEMSRTAEQRKQDFEGALASFAFLSQVKTEEGVIDQDEMQSKSLALNEALRYVGDNKREIFKLRIGLGEAGGPVSWKKIAERPLYVYGRRVSLGSAKRAYSQVLDDLARQEDLVAQFMPDTIQ